MHDNDYAESRPLKPLHNYQVGERVIFNSSTRPDFLPSDISRLGCVLKTTHYGLSVQFDDMPDEPIYLSFREVRRASGCEPKAPPKKKPVTKAQKLNWLEWEKPPVEKKGQHDTAEDLPCVTDQLELFQD
jgi:hypothetical protein